MADFGPEILRILRTNGCLFVRHGMGDRSIWYNPLTCGNRTLDSNAKSRYLANTIMKQAGTEHRF